MAANSKSGKSGRSSKTDRVLGLLTDPGSGSPSGGSGGGTSTNRQTAAPRLDDKAAQAQIHDALAEELASAFPEPINPTVKIGEPASLDTAPAEPPQAPSRPPRRPVPRPAPTPSAQAAAPTPVQQTEQIRQPKPVTPPAHIPEPVPKTVAKPEEQHFYYNIAQSLVEAKVDNYIKITGVCGCERCRLDVMALALTNLPPKYVVTRSTDLIPRLGVYEQKNAAEISAQIISACNTVKNRPHHKREE